MILGRDVLTRLIYGIRASLTGCLLATGISAVLGVPIGLAAGFIGGWLDTVVSRFIDALLSYPAIVLAIGVTGALGPGLVTGMIAVGITFSPQFARLARARAQLVQREPFVDAARGFGAGRLEILWYHVLPNAAPPLIVHATLLLAAALLAEASLSFLGLGVQPPAASWGGMLARAYTNMESAPGQMYAPGLAILLGLAVAFNGLGQSLRRILDPEILAPHRERSSRKDNKAMMPFEQLRVVEIGSGVALAYCGKIFADFRRFRHEDRAARRRYGDAPSCCAAGGGRPGPAG